MRDLEASIAAAGAQNAEGCVKIADDLARYREIIERVRPDVIVECGTFTGASAMWFAERAPLALVITIDYDEPPRISAEAYDHPRILAVRGNSADPEVVAFVHRVAREYERVLVVLDADHGTDSVLAELDAYHDLVTPGSYIVVEDTICRWLTGDIVAPYVGTPYDAVDRWLPAHPEFIADMEIEDMLPCTQNPGGWLRRIA